MWKVETGEKFEDKFCSSKGEKQAKDECLLKVCLLAVFFNFLFSDTVNT